ncbi:hypothetical protein F5B22DRAFT_594662 [Xylaria bambusicola]|uniref:uncharacterized protein n=1 Tax=Xylaria bambusicola TaxID=326684 RepID=UPI002007C594|nr:uncharacterized protein F5B22DRAFT_594662 [Xylaria bambusicola]KAI0521902.1 hypothetical protein F5B22DRAFT_594662 [Xylaria bambusicola]
MKHLAFLLQGLLPGSSSSSLSFAVRYMLRCTLAGWVSTRSLFLPVCVVCVLQYYAALCIMIMYLLQPIYI